MSTEHKPQSVPRFTLSAYFSAPKPCEDALLDLGNAWNNLADQWEVMHAALAAVATSISHDEAKDIARETLDGL